MMNTLVDVVSVIRRTKIEAKSIKMEIMAETKRMASSPIRASRASRAAVSKHKFG